MPGLVTAKSLDGNLARQAGGWIKNLFHYVKTSLSSAKHQLGVVFSLC